MAGGYNTTAGYLASAELYNPSTGKWSLTGSLHTARFYHAMVLLANGKVLVAGGLDPAGCCGAPPPATAELYDPSTGKWTETGSMTTPRESFAMVLLPNGQVLAAGADNNGAFLTSAAKRRLADDFRAFHKRQFEGQFEPGRPRLLLVFYIAVHSVFAIAGGRPLSWRAVRRSANPRCCHLSGIHTL